MGVAPIPKSCVATRAAICLRAVAPTEDEDPPDGGHAFGTDLDRGPAILRISAGAAFHVSGRGSA